MAEIIVQGITDKTLEYYVEDILTGQPKTGLSTGDVTLISYTRGRNAPVNVTSSLDSRTGAGVHTDWAVTQKSSDDDPGVYQLDVADAVWQAGVSDGSVRLNFGSLEDPSYRCVPVRFQLTQFSQETVFNLMKHVTSGAVVADGGNTAQTFKIDTTSTMDDAFGDLLIRFVDSTAGLFPQAAQVQKPNGYNGATDKFLTLKTPLSSAPNAGDGFQLFNN
jgi:hypothetical protein